MTLVTPPEGGSYYNASRSPSMTASSISRLFRGHRCRRAGGFTMVEILVTIAIIGIIAIFVIPNFLDSLNKAKQKRTMADMHEIGTAMISWVVGSPGQRASPGASGNIVTEDLVYMFEAMGVDTGIDLARLMALRPIIEEGLPGEPLYGFTPDAGLPKSYKLGRS